MPYLQMSNVIQDFLVAPSLHWLTPFGFSALYAVASHVYQPPELVKPADGSGAGKPVLSQWAPSKPVLLAHNLALAVYSLITFVIGFRHLRSDFSTLPFWEANCDTSLARWEVRLALYCVHT